MLKVVFLGYLWKIPKELSDSKRFKLVGIGVEYIRKSTEVAVENLSSLSELIFDAKDINKNFKKLECFNDVDIIVIGAFGQILKKEILGIPKLGVLNFHTSYLPSYRGNNPIESQLMDDCLSGGVTMHWVDEGVDTGKVALQKAYNFDANDHYLDILDNYHDLCADIIKDLSKLDVLAEIPRLSQTLLGTDRPCRAFNNESLIVSINEGLPLLHRKIKAYGHTDRVRWVDGDNYFVFKRAVLEESLSVQQDHGWRIADIRPLRIVCKNFSLKILEYDTNIDFSKLIASNFEG